LEFIAWYDRALTPKIKMSCFTKYVEACHQLSTLASEKVHHSNGTLAIVNVLEEANLFEIDEYITQRQISLVGSIASQLILQICGVNSEWMAGSPIQ